MSEKFTPKIFDSEYRFALIVWEKEPVFTRELVALSAERLGWKRTTAYTVLKRLCERRVLRVENGAVVSVVKKEEAQVSEGEQFLSSRFGGSLPSFVAAFTRQNKLSDEDARQIRRLIDEYGEDGHAG